MDTGCLDRLGDLVRCVHDYCNCPLREEPIIPYKWPYLQYERLKAGMPTVHLPLEEQEKVKGFGKRI